MAALRRFKRRETLRIAYGDIIRDQRLEHGDRADFVTWPTPIVEAALRFARRRLAEKRGRPHAARRPAGAVCRAGHGQAGRRGTELLQRHRPDLSLRRRRPHRRRAPIANSEFFDRVAREVVRLLTEATALAMPTASICGCAPKANAARSSIASNEPCTITTCSAAPGNARPSSRPAPWPATWTWATSSSNTSNLGSIADTWAWPTSRASRPSNAASSSERAPRRRRRSQRQDRPRRHPRRRVRHPVPATAQRRRPAGAAQRQHAGGDRRAREMSAA